VRFKFKQAELDKDDLVDLFANVKVHLTSLKKSPRHQGRGPLDSDH
jgi:hypothetical protein